MTEKWSIESSFEDLRNIDDWLPEADEIKRVYMALTNKEPIKLHWKSPGYRPPTPDEDVKAESEEPETFDQTEEASDFDFQEESGSLSLRKRRDGDAELKGSAKKRTTNLDDVLSNIRRHRKLQRDLDGDLAVPIDSLKINPP